MAELAQRLRLDLTDSLSRDVELLADLFKRVVRVHVDAEAHAQDLRLARREPGQDGFGRLAQAFVGRRIDRRADRRVLDEVAEMRIFIIADGRLHGDRLLGDLQHLANLVFRHLHALAQLFRRGLTAHLLQHLAGNPVELVDRLDHVHRNPDGPGLIGDRARDGLTNPPGRVGRELVSAAVFELVHGLHETDVSFLDEVEELQTTVCVLLGDRDNETEVRLNHVLLRAAGLGLSDRHGAIDLFDLENREAGLVRHVGQLALSTAQFVGKGRELRCPILLSADLTLEPALVGFAPRKFLEEDLLGHPALADHDRGKHLLLCAHLVKEGADVLDHRVEVLRGELQRSEVLGQLCKILLGRVAVAAVTLDVALRLLELLPDRFKALRSLDGIRPDGRIVVVVVLVLVSALLDLRRRRHVVRRIEIADEHIGQLVVGNSSVVRVNDVLDRTRELRQGRHDVSQTLLDALGNLDLALAREQFHGAHFTHVHAHRVRRPARLGLDRGECRCSLFGREIVGGRVAGAEQFVRVRRLFVNVDAHLGDHPDDVFDLIRIRDIAREMVIHLGVGEVPLLLALGDEFLELGLLLCGLCSHGAPRSASCRGSPVTARSGPALVCRVRVLAVW